MKYIKRSSEGTMISAKTEEYSSKGLKQSINDLCVCNLSTFEGREKAAGIILNRKGILPIYINEDICLFPTESIRNYTCIYINYSELLSFKGLENKKTKIVFYDLSELIITISYEKIKKQVKRVQTILAKKNSI